LARAKNVKNRRPHKLVLEGELAEIIKRRKAGREYKAPSGPGTSMYVFHRNGKRISDPRRAWARACYDAGLPCEIVYKKDFKGKPVLHKRGPHKGEPVIEKILSKMIFHDLRAEWRSKHGPRWCPRNGRDGDQRSPDQVHF
jgi:hypothetical protein